MNQDYFNTSHVNVNHRFIASESFGLIHFNTSHVNVNLDRKLNKPFNLGFQYISC